VQQGSVETLYQNGNSLEQIAGFTVVARYRRDFLPKLRSRIIINVFIGWQYETQRTQAVVVLLGPTTALPSAPFVCSVLSQPPMPVSFSPMFVRRSRFPFASRTTRVMRRFFE